jgi:hypothetical protein
MRKHGLESYFRAVNPSGWAKPNGEAESIDEDKKNANIIGGVIDVLRVRRWK